jgi:hypothetical protein
VNGYNFTERVRKILALARDESERFRHEYIGTEHILLGIILEGEGISSAILLNLSIDPAAIRRRIEEVVKVGKSTAKSTPALPYTSRAKKVLELAMAEARVLSHNYIGSEHLLLGLVREEKGIAAQVLCEAGLTVDKARAETIRLLGTSGMPREHFRGSSFVASISATFPPELDALVAAPEYHQVLLENEHVRVLDTRIPAGETTPLHTHVWPATHCVLSWSHFVRRDSKGTVLLDTRQTDFNQNVPQALWGAPLMAHTLENVGTAPLHIISVEIKSLAGLS